MYRKKDLVKEIKFNKQLLKKFKETVFRYDMIKPGDKILVGFSGGKDSTALVLLLKYLQLTSGIDFEFETLIIHYGMDGESYEKQINRLHNFDIKTNIFKTNIFELSKTKVDPNSSFCSFISRMRRGKLTEYALDNDFNKIALGHHLDDAAESLMMGILKNGVIRSLPPIYKNKYNQIIIRPLILNREKQLAKFCRVNEFEVLGDEMCPGMCMGRMPSAREKTKQRLALVEKEDPMIFNSIENALQNVNTSALLDKKNLKIFQKKKPFWRRWFCG